VVTFAGVRGGYGNTVEIDHRGGEETLSAHQAELLVDQGDRVRRGQVIGRVGSTGSSTGPHLHFEYTLSEREQDPLTLLPAA
jgi:murein DD-endopeptidase MepM/ murein hydrolase activator NlpD